MPTQKAFATACREFFGLRENTTLKDFVVELKELTAADRVEIREGLIANGYDVAPLPN